MNYYLTAIEGIPKMLECVENPVKYFRKNSYKEMFEKVYHDFVPVFDAIENGYNTVIDKDQFLMNMAEALASHAVEMVEGCKRRSQKDQQMMDLNFIMAVFVFPSIYQYGGNSTQPLVDKLLDAWKKAFPKTNLSAADYETIEKGFHRKWCYITTAVCDSFGKSDDCYELRVLRNYRDTYLEASEDGEQMIREYYDLAPSIVKHINQKENSADVYRSIWDSYLSPCLTMIENGELEACRDHYKKMVYDLRDAYFYQ